MHNEGSSVLIWGNIKTDVYLSLQWLHNEHYSVSNHQPRDCLLNPLFGRRSKKTSKLRVTGLYAGNSLGTGEFPAHMASNAENVSIWWCHHVFIILNPETEQLACIYMDSLHHGWRWPVDGGSQGINSHCFGPFLPEYSSLYTWDVKGLTSSPLKYMQVRFCIHMMTSSNGNIFRVTGPLCGEFTGHRRIFRT